MGGEGKFWEVGAEQPTKKSDSAAGKEKPAEVERTQPLLTSGIIKKPVAAAPQDKEQKPAEPEPKKQEKTKAELETDKSQRVEVAQRLYKETTDRLDELSAQISDRMGKCNEEVEALETKRKNETERLDKWKESQSVNINYVKAEHISHAEQQMDAAKNEAAKQYDELLGKFESEKKEAIAAVDAWYDARIYEADPQNHPSVYLAGIIKDKRLASALETERAEPSPMEFLTPVLNAIRDERDKRLEAINKEFNEKKKVIEDSRADKEKKADETLKAAIKEAEREVEAVLKDVSGTHATSVADMGKSIDKDIANAKAEAEVAIASLYKKKEEAQHEFDSKIKILRKTDTPIPKELLVEVEPKKTETKEEAQIKVEPPQEKKQQVESVSAVRFKPAKIAFWTTLIAGSAIAGTYLNGWQPSSKLISTVQGYVSPIEIAAPKAIRRKEIRVQPVASVTIASIKQIKEVPKPVLAPEPVKHEQKEVKKAVKHKHVLTLSEFRARQARIAAIKRAVVENKANEYFVNALKGFKSSIATMKNEKGFLGFGKESVYLASEMAILLDTNGKNLSAKDKVAIANALSYIRKGGMKRKDLLKLQQRLKDKYDASLHVKTDAGNAATKAAEKKETKKEGEAKKVGTNPVKTQSAPKNTPVVAAANKAEPTKKRDIKVEKPITTLPVKNLPTATTSFVSTDAAAPFNGVQKSTGQVNVSLPLTYSASGGIKPPWITTNLATEANKQSNAPSQQQVKVSSNTTTEKVPDKTVTGSKTESKEQPKAEEKPNEESKKAERTNQPDLMIVGNVIYAYTGLKVDPTGEQTVYWFTTKKYAEAAYQKAMEEAKQSPQ